MNIFSRENDKVIVSVRNYKSIQARGLYGALYKFASKLFYNRADIIVAVSEGVKKDLIDNFGVNRDKVVVIYNPYDLEYIQKSSKDNVEKEEEAIFSKGNKIVMTAGRLHWQKGQWHLIKVFKALKDSMPEAKLIILGEGPLKYKLENLANNLGLDDSVHFLGFKQNPFKYYSRADVFVLPSLVEGFPNVLVEAMACGAPVISTDCKSGPREIIAPKLFDSMGYDQQIEKLYFSEFGTFAYSCNIRPPVLATSGHSIR